MRHSITVNRYGCTLKIRDLDRYFRMQPEPVIRSMLEYLGATPHQHRDTMNTLAGFFRRWNPVLKETTHQMAVRHHEIIQAFNAIRRDHHVSE